jgi:tRNA(Ile)-lysidine synthase
MTPEQTDRFRSDFEALAGAAPERLGIAVSGGPDSLALLLLAHAAFPGRVHAATVDHRLRPESAEEAEFVARVCAALSVPHSILSDQATPIAGGNVQAQARELRYRLLADWAAPLGWLATGHHQDDQAETILMRLARGAGLAGLAAIRPRRSLGPVTLVRPLVGWRRIELARIVAEAGLDPVDDPSNRADGFDRTRIRALLAERGEALPAARLAASAAHLGEAEEALAWSADREWAERASFEPGAIALDPSGLPTELVRRLAARAIDSLRGDPDWRRDKLASALAEVERGGTVTLAGVKIEAGERWRFAPEPPRR